MASDLGDDLEAPPSAGDEVIELWRPAGPPRAIEGSFPETAFRMPFGPAADTAMIYNVSEPTLTVCRPDPRVANGVGVIVCPGGAWRFLAWEHEGTDVAAWLVERGYTAFLLKYRVAATRGDPGATLAKLSERTEGAPARPPRPLPAAKAPTAAEQFIRDERLRYAREIAADDGRRALAVVRERAAAFGLCADKVGMIGFSAGAFLIVDVTVDPQGPPPAFVAPIYGGETRGRPVPDDAPPLFAVVAQ